MNYFNFPVVEKGTVLLYSVVMEVEKRIRFLREQHGLKQINLANVLQISPQAASKWEQGANYPTLTHYFGCGSRSY
ncbi:MAG: hypothetical protein C0399_05330 [Syntrophus sp. (in: bacteria)]|nr:hypothetical protein [Syntrophus sp. (in: bacteria)]